jgi:hypothetical protein
MKRDVLAIGLVSVVMLSTLATVGMCYWYLKMARDVRQQQTAMKDINRSIGRNRQALQSLALDLNGLWAAESGHLAVAGADEFADGYPD